MLKRVQAELCAENMGEELAYMGTQTVVRDIDFMTTVMDGEDALMSVSIHLSITTAHIIIHL